MDFLDAPLVVMYECIYIYGWMHVSMYVWIDGPTTTTTTTATGATY